MAGRRRNVMRINLNLDDRIDQELISFLKKSANGGALSKALYLYVNRTFWTKPKNGQKQAELGRNGSILSQNEPELNEIGESENEEITEVLEEELIAQMKAWEKAL